MLNHETHSPLAHARNGSIRSCLRQLIKQFVRKFTPHSDEYLYYCPHKPSGPTALLLFKALIVSWTFTGTGFISLWLSVNDPSHFLQEIVDAASSYTSPYQAVHGLVSIYSFESAGQHFNSFKKQAVNFEVLALLDQTENTVNFW